MKHFITTLLLAISCNCLALNVAQLFMAEPGKLFPTLSDGTRAEMITHFNNGDTSVIMAYMGVDAKIKELDTTANYIKFSTSKAQTVEIKLLISSNYRDTVIAVINTLSTPAPDSRISFYNTKWKKLDTDKYFKMPTLESFRQPKVDKEQWLEVDEVISFPVIKLEFDGKGHNTLTATLPLPEIYTPDVWMKVAPYLKSRIHYTITGTKIKQENTR